MSANSEIGLSSIRSNLRFRVESLRRVLAGELGPVDRRRQMAQRRPTLKLGITPEREDSHEEDTSTDEEGQDESPEQEPDLPDTAEGVVIEAMAPTEEGVQAANTLAQRRVDIEEVRVRDDDKLELQRATGEAFIKDASTVLGQSRGRTGESDAVSEETPTMSRAAASKRSG